MRRTALLAAVVAVAMAIPLGVYASHQFTDVPDSNVFHNSIDWMKDNAITVGCNPPANTQYCPDDSVTRGQMAAFMKRLSEKEVVNAGLLGGAGPSSYQGSVAGVIPTTVTPPGATPTVLATLNPFEVPQSGGALAASADLSLTAGGPDLVIVWIEIDGSGLCNGVIPNTWGYHFFVSDPYGAASTSTTAAANAGSHRIDLCGITANGAVNFGVGAMTVQWVETTQLGTTAGASSGMTAGQLLDELSSASFSE